MDKEKQNRFDCKHLECNMDGCYCKAGHGYGYGWCVIPFKLAKCAYFEKKQKRKKVEINENEIVISKEEKQKLLKEMYEQGKFDAIADLDKEGKVVISKDNYNRLKRDSELYEVRHKEKLKLFAKAYNQGCKETAEKIYAYVNSFGTHNWERFKKFIKQFGVDLGGQNEIST